MEYTIGVGHCFKNSILHPLLIPKVEIQRPTTALRVGKFKQNLRILHHNLKIQTSYFTEVYRILQSKGYLLKNSLAVKKRCGPV